jgi:hypothetical protein
VITPEIRYFFSPDIDDLENHQPGDPEKFSFLLQVMIGPKGSKGEESFDLVVSTPAWLAVRYGPVEVLSGEHRLLVFQYDWASIEAFVRKRVADCTGSDWDEVAHKLGCFARWEFDGYQPWVDSGPTRAPKAIPSGDDGP